MRKIPCSTLSLSLSLSLSLLFAPAAVFAAGKMKPGLWAMTVKSDAMEQAMKSMPKMSAEQIEQMRKLGLAIPQRSADGFVSNVCISKETAERDQAPPMKKEADCQPKNYQHSGDHYSVDFVCDGAMMKGEGKAKGTFSSNENYTSTYDFNGTAHGQPISHHMESNGKWLGADCGTLKPM